MENTKVMDCEIKLECNDDEIEKEKEKVMDSENQLENQLDGAGYHP